MMIIPFILVFIGGGLGSVFRFLLGNFISDKNFNPIYSTLSANVISCLIIAVVLAASINGKNSYTQIFWAVGFCGGLSTFSTFSWQNWQLIQNQQWGLLSFNIFTNIFLTLGAIWLGLKLSNSL